MAEKREILIGTVKPGQSVEGEDRQGTPKVFKEGEKFQTLDTPQARAGLKSKASLKAVLKDIVTGDTEIVGDVE